MAYPAFQHDPTDHQRDGAVRLWLSQRQWMSVLEETERKARQTSERDGMPADNQRQSPRLPAPEDTRCLIRLGDNTDDHGTYLVQLANVSATGLGFNSAHAFTPRTRCTVALQDPQGHGLVCAAGVVWCRPINDQVHDVGIQFDQPIDPSRFTSQTPGQAT